MPYRPKKYSRLQLVAYHTPTLLGSDVSDPAATPTHPAIHSLMNPDEKSRVKRMYQVVLWAADHKNVDPSPATLKLFVAPEFYFKTVAATESNQPRRSAGQHGAYSFNTMQNIMACLQKIFTSPFNKPSLLTHWLLIPGTIVSDLPTDGKTFGADNYYLNTAVAIKGEPGGLFHFIQKHAVSHIDGPSHDRGVFSGSSSPFKATVAKLAEKGHDEGMSRLFTVDNVRFALEVCKDHDDAVLKNHLETSQKLKKLPKSAGSVDVHVVTSCGMTLQQGKIVAKAGGYAVICDGAPGNDHPRSDVRKVTVRSTGGATLEDSKWTITTDQPPELAGKVRGREAVPDALKVKPLTETDVYMDGKKAHANVSADAILFHMFPDEVVWYEPVSL